MLRAPDPFRINFEQIKIQDIKWLVSQLNTHKHTSTCYKYSKNIERKTCRMRIMPREMFSISTINPDSGEIRMRRSHPMINNFNSNLIDSTVDEEEETVSAIEEQFLIEHSSDPQKLVLVNLRVDYQYRSVALESICLYEFVSHFYRKSFNDRDREIVDRSSQGAAQNPSGSGRPPQERYTFTAKHPQAKSHGIIKRTEPVVPVLVGPQIPRQDREETRERYSRAIATLFIPWRSVRELCDINQSWSEALSARQQNISGQSQKIIENIQLLHDCKTDRDAHLQQIIGNIQSNDQIESRLFPQNMRIDSDNEDEDADQTLLNLDFLDDLTDNNRKSVVGFFSEKEQLYQNEAIRCLKEVGRFSDQIGMFILFMKDGI